MSFLGRQRTLVEREAAAWTRDQAALEHALAETAREVRRTMSSPQALLLLFGAGVVYGLLRRLDHETNEQGQAEPGSADDDEQGPVRRALGSRVTRAAVALGSAARLLELARRADRFGV